MKALSFIMLLSWAFCAHAQVIDDFSDGDFTSNPEWSGTTTFFLVNSSKQLQLNALTAGSASMSTTDTLIDNTEWVFYVRLAFSPSSSNFMRFYLVSDIPDLRGSVHGYYVQIGEAGSLDGVDLYKQYGSGSTLLINGLVTDATKTNNTIRVRVTRDGAGNWTLYSDSAGGTNYQKEGEAKDAVYTKNLYSGVYAQYTASNITKVYWDDISIHRLITDTAPPKAIEIKPVDSSTIQVTFSEPLDSSTAKIISNYNVPLVGQPDKVTVKSSDLRIAILHFAKAFVTRKMHTLEVSGVKDLSGNTMTDSGQLAFIYYQAVIGELVINEIFADPTPSKGLPEEEFIEVLNTSVFPILTSGLSISDGGSTAFLPKDTILPGEYRIITGNAGAFSAYPKAVQAQNFPSLNNAGDKLQLRDASGYIIDEVSYSDEWYRDDIKKDGGYSMERINPLEYCKKGENWIASKEGAGGTPGKVNSVYSNVADTVAPQLISFTLLDSNSIKLIFDEPVDSTISSPAACRLNGINTSPAISFSSDKKNIELIFPVSFVTGQTALSVSRISDCLQNKDSVHLQFYYIKPLPASRYDIVINEVMSDAKAPHIPARYIELFNRSNKPILLKDWRFEDAVSGAKLPAYLLMPDSFAVLCSINDASKLNPYCANIIALSSFPTLNISSDSLFLYDNKNALIDFLHYSSDWHTDDLKKTGGWSLELKDANHACNPLNNWTSSKGAKGGTPGIINSVKGTIKDKTGPELIKVIPVDSITVMLHFSEPLDSGMAANTSHYALTDNSITIQSAVPVFPDFRKVALQLGASLAKGKIYGLSVKEIADCSGNQSDEKVISFGLPETADSFGIVINEILFNPESGGVDFVELYNRSDKVINLQDFYIATADGDNALRDPAAVSADGYLLLPENYCVLTTDKKILDAYHYLPNPGAVIEVSDLPGMPDDKGAIVLVRMNGDRIDQVNYSEDWHFPLLSNEEGVSLEKINPTLPSQDKNAWHSASSAVNYSTPTYINSQYQALSNATAKNPFSIDPPVLSPDGDGYQDILNIQYAFDNPGHMATIEIFDKEGRLVRTLQNNQLLGTSGYLYWDGLTDRGEKARIGVYILLLSTYTSSGEMERYKMTATVVGRF